VFPFRRDLELDTGESALTGGRLLVTTRPTASHNKAPHWID
jgi:hypothetical protein